MTASRPKGVSQSRYAVIADALEAEMAGLGANALLPAEERLAARFGVSRLTVRGALDLLERRGLVSRMRGRGTTVNPPKITRRFSPLYSFEKDLAAQGVAFETRVLSFERDAGANADARRQLGLAGDQAVGRLRLLRLVHGLVVCHDIRCYPPEIAAGLNPQRMESEDASEVVEDLAGVRIEESEWESEIVSAPPEVAAALEIAPRALVLSNAYVWRSEAGRAMEVGSIHYRIDRCRFRYELPFRHSEEPAMRTRGKAGS
jgi:GntR family transcriptional regulator